MIVPVTVVTTIWMRLGKRPIKEGLWLTLGEAVDVCTDVTVTVGASAVVVVRMVSNAETPVVVVIV